MDDEAVQLKNNGRESANVRTVGVSVFYGYGRKSTICVSDCEEHKDSCTKICCRTLTTGHDISQRGG